MLLLILYLLTNSVASELSCLGHFPMKESVDIVKKIVAKYAIPILRKDDSGVEWMNNLILKNQGLEVDGTRYFLNDNRLPPEMTFYFEDSLIFDSVPIFVVDEDQLEKWRPDFPDKTYALTKISHQCAVGQRACGLKCCYDELDKVQKGFLEQKVGGNLSSTVKYVYNDVTYFLEQTDDNYSSVKCSYDLSYYDILFRNAVLNGKSISTIFFSCPETSSCCDLTCLPPSKSALLRKPRMVKSLPFKFHRQRDALLITGTVIALIAFVAIIYINYRITSTYSIRSSNDFNCSKCRESRQTVDTQTSTLSLHVDVDSRALLEGVQIA